MLQSPVQQTRLAIGLVTRQITPETARAHPQQFRRLLLAQTTLIPTFRRFQKTHLPHLFLHERPLHLNPPWNSQGDTMTTGQLSRYNSGQIGSSLHTARKQRCAHTCASLECDRIYPCESLQDDVDVNAMKGFSI
jgi:hypothetical protein